MKTDRRLSLIGCLVALSACSGGGSAPKSGGLEVVIESDMTIPRDLDRVTLVATQNGRRLLQVDEGLGPGALLIPAAFDITGDGTSSPVTINAVGYKAGEARVERDALTPIPDRRDGELWLALNYLCVGTASMQPDGSVVSTCPTGLTCIQGSCQTSTVPQSSVPTYVPGSVPGADGGSGTITDGGVGAGCFDVPACFAGAVAAVVDPASCAITLPADTDPATVNVALQFPAGGSGVCGASACWVVFDKGTGWTLEGNTLQLPKAVCTSAGANGGTVVVSMSCLPKTEAQPNCGAWSSVTTPAPQPGTPPLAPSCTGPASQSCGLCGVQTRTCTNGTWSAWGACTGEGVCMPTATRICDANGIQTCGGNCEWGSCGCPAGQTSCGGTCTALDSDVRDCGGCGNDCTQLPQVAAGSAACVSGRCTYGCVPGYQDCSGAGQGCTTSLDTVTNCGACGAACGAGAPMCAPGSGGAGGGGGGAAGSGGVGGAGASPSFQCVSGCPASAPTLCTGSCANLTTSSANCGACGHACTGGATCQGGTCVCPTGTQACGSSCTDTRGDNANCGRCGQSCPAGSTCTNSVCACSGPASQSCGKCGTQSRTCTNGTWSAWSACGGEGVCAAGTTTGCTNGTQTCDQTCKLSACQCLAGFTSCAGACVNEQTDAFNCGSCGHACPQGTSCQSGRCTCPPDPTTSTTRACGNCGTQARTCNDGAWSAWSTCTGSGACAPGATQTCDTTGTATCDSTCQWGSCVCPTGSVPCSGECLNLQTNASNCGSCGHPCPQGSTCQAGACACSGPSSQACGNCGTQTRTCSDGTWSAWSACAGGGACAAGTTQACTNGTETCDSTCQWGSCVCKTGYSSCSGQCVNEQSDNSNCGACGKVCGTKTTCRSGTCVPTDACDGVACSGGLVCELISAPSCVDPNWAEWPVPSDHTTGLSANSDGTVTDTVTELEWQQAVPAGTMTQAAAVSYCPTLTLGGHTNWRLPSFIELLSIVDYGQTSGPMIDRTSFPSTPSVAFWTSTLLAGNASSAWAVGFSDGSFGPQSASNALSVRCVR